MADSDTVNLDLAAATAMMKISKVSFAQVSFRKIEESYPVGTDVECSYRINKALEVSSRDWVGLYKVGWRSSAEYIYYEWSPMPQNYTAGSEVESKIVFPGNKMPADDGEFYQFCYVTSSGHVRGASTPFQFKVPFVDELIEIEDENGELLVIKTKTAVLEEQLKKGHETQTQLRKEIQILQSERDILLLNERELKKKLQKERDELEFCQRQLQESGSTIIELEQEVADVQSCLRTLQDKIEVVNQEKQSMEKRLDDSDVYIVSLQEKIKSLVNEKDALTGQVRSLEEEKELYRGHYSTSESTLLSYQQECERLHVRLTKEESCSSRIKKEVERMEQELAEQQNRLEQQMTVSQMDKEQLDCLSERLHNAEDKLSAAELCKTMLNEEVLALKQAYEKVSDDLELSRAESDNVSRKSQTVVQKLASERDDIKLQLEAVTLTLQQEIERGVSCQEEAVLLQSQIKQQAEREAEGPLYALQTAQNTLKERYSKMAKKNDELQKSLEQAFCRVRELEENDMDQTKEIASLRDRLLMGQEAYKEKYIELERLQDDLYRQQQQHRRLSRASPPVKSSSVGDDALRSSELNDQMSDIALELERRNAKIIKFKRLYMDEREKNTLLSATIQSEPVVRGPPDMLYKMAVYPPSTSPQMSVVAQNVDVVPSFDHLVCEDTPKQLSVPLKPLPAPMLPERLHPVPRSTTTDTPDVVSDRSAREVEAATALEEERFEDAPGEPQRSCPVCSLTFPLGMKSLDMVDHVEKHLCGPVCPMCNEQFEVGYTDRSFSDHVQEHFDDF